MAKKKPKIVIFLLLPIGLYMAYQEGGLRLPGSERGTESSDAFGGDAVYQAYQNRQSNLQVEGQGEIVKILPDDIQGSRHQKFIVGPITIQRADIREAGCNIGVNDLNRA